MFLASMVFPRPVGKRLEASEASAGEAAFDAASLTVLEIVGDEVFEEDGGVPSACGWPQRCGR